MRGMWGAVLLLLAGVCQAQSAPTAELRLPVSGEIGIDPQGKVFDFTIASILTPEVKGVVERAVKQWSFEPVTKDGAAVHAKARMYLTLVATPVGEGYQLRIERLRFAADRPSTLMFPPTYPQEAARRGIGADVLVALRVGADGKVRDAVAVQTSMPDAEGGGKKLDKLRRMFEQSAVATARKWEFRPSDASQEDVTLIVPIAYLKPGSMLSAMDGWRDHAAGRQNPIPWLPESEQSFDATGLKQGETLAVGDALKLRTSVVGTAL